MPAMLSLSRKIVRCTNAFTHEQVTPELIAKVKTALFDMLSCVYEARDLPWSQQALKIATRGEGPAHIFGSALPATTSDAAFVNAILGHGLVREDMHTGSVSHLGVVVLPTLLALAESKKVSGREFVLAVISGYETGCVIGKAVMDQPNVKQYRPTGITGPPAAAIGGARLLGLNEDQMVSALGFAANSTVGLNEWPYSGGDEMFFHVGFAARNAVTSVELAELGANASESSLDGIAGLFAALRKTDKISSVIPFGGPRPEILDVYHKPAQACNYAQTATQCAAALSVPTADINGITVRCTAAAAAYPGCDYTGPFEKTLQAKMSIQFCVAAALSRGVIEEANYRVLDHAEINRLARLIRLEIDPALTSAYPGLQGAEVIITLRDGKTMRHALSDVIPATPEQIRTRFASAAQAVLGTQKTEAAREFIETLDHQPNAGALCAMLAV
jgi:2-methylcitrate dehydratase PrpD